MSSLGCEPFPSCSFDDVCVGHSSDLSLRATASCLLRANEFLLQRLLAFYSA
jgi:hypothetical protein